VRTGRVDAEEDVGRSGQLVVDADLPVESPASIAPGGGDGERKNEQRMRRVGAFGRRSRPWVGRAREQRRRRSRGTPARSRVSDAGQRDRAMRLGTKRCLFSFFFFTCSKRYTLEGQYAVNRSSNRGNLLYRFDLELRSSGISPETGREQFLGIVTNAVSR
jgi:hypothetical protein